LKLLKNLLKNLFDFRFYKSQFEVKKIPMVFVVRVRTISISLYPKCCLYHYWNASIYTWI